MQYQLTESLEDYLLEIFIINREKTNIRIKDIAKRRHVKLPSVVKALDELSRKKYIDHEKYGYVELTDYGMQKAKKLYDRHRIVYRFFHNILALDEYTAEQNAHKMEHDLDVKTITIITKFTNFIENFPGHIKKNWNENFQYFNKTGKYKNKYFLEGDSTMNKIEEKNLSELNIRESGKIIRIKAGIGSLKSKLLDMGAVPGTIVKIDKKAPLGDPIDVQILDYHLTLRKDEAENIIIEEI